MSRKRCHVPAMSIEHKAQRGSGGTGRAAAERAAEQSAQQARNDRPEAPQMAAAILGQVPDRLCLLSVHAHPDDEASKGAPTVAKYHAEGVHTVLVTATGGEEGDILNPA